MSRCLPFRSSGDSDRSPGRKNSGCRCWSLCWLLGWHKRFGWVWSLGGWALPGSWVGFTSADRKTPRENEMRWISKQMNHHRWGSSYSWAQARFLPKYVFLIYIPHSLCWCPWITNGLSNLWESFLNSAMCRDSTVSQIRGPSQMSPFPASRVTDFSWNPISLKPPFVPGFNLQQREIKHESDGSCRFGSQSYACSQCFFEILLQGLLCNAIQGSLYWIVGGSEYLYKYAFEWWLNPISCGPADETNELPVCLLVFGGPPRRTNLRWWFLIHQQIPPFFVEKKIWTDQWGAYKHTLNFIPSYLWYPNNIFLSAWLSAAISPQLHRRQRSSLARSLTTSEFNNRVA